MTVALVTVMRDVIEISVSRPWPLLSLAAVLIVSACPMNEPDPNATMETSDGDGDGDTGDGDGDTGDGDGDTGDGDGDTGDGDSDTGDGDGGDGDGDTGDGDGDTGDGDGDTGDGDGDTGDGDGDTGDGDGDGDTGGGMCLEGGPIDDNTADCPGDASCDCMVDGDCSTNSCVQGQCKTPCTLGSCDLSKDGVADLRLSVRPVNFEFGERYEPGTELEVLYKYSAGNGEGDDDGWIVVRDGLTGALELARFGRIFENANFLDGVGENEDDWLWPLEIVGLGEFEPCPPIPQMPSSVIHREFIELAHEGGEQAVLIDQQAGWGPGCYHVDVENLDWWSTDLYNTFHHDVTIARAGCDGVCGEPVFTEECEEPQDIEHDDVEIEWLDTVQLGDDLPFGYYVATLECVVLERADELGWLHHELDCTRVEWFTIAP